MQSMPDWEDGWKNREVKIWESKSAKKFNPLKNKTQEATEEVQKISRDSEYNETMDLPITVTMMRATYNRKTIKGKNYVDVIKVTQT